MRNREILHCTRCARMYNTWDLNDDGVCYLCEDETLADTALSTEASAPLPATHPTDATAPRAD